MSRPEVVSLRTRTRQVMRDEVVGAALRLFDERGYDAVSMEFIAGSVGMSRRTLHRYFSSKDEIVLGRFDELGDAFVELLRARPMDESEWESLRQIFSLAHKNRDETLAGQDEEVARIINGSLTLFAGYLQRTQGAQVRLADVLRARASQRGSVTDPADPTFDAIVAAACACRTVAVSVSASAGLPFPEALDRSMGALRPRKSSEPDE
jgi:AcrR family transcriptional regulator